MKISIYSLTALFAVYECQSIDVLIDKTEAMIQESNYIPESLIETDVVREYKKEEKKDEKKHEKKAEKKAEKKEEKKVEKKVVSKDCAKNEDACTYDYCLKHPDFKWCTRSYCYNFLHKEKK